MEKITVRNRTNQPLSNIGGGKNKKSFTSFLDSFLLEKGRNFIKSQQLGSNYKFNSITDLISESLNQFQNKELELVGDRNLTNPRTNTSFILTGDLIDFYLTLPKGQRVGILERCLG